MNEVITELGKVEGAEVTLAELYQSALNELRVTEELAEHASPESSYGCTLADGTSYKGTVSALTKHLKRALMDCDSIHLGCELDRLMNAMSGTAEESQLEEHVVMLDGTVLTGTRMDLVERIGTQLWKIEGMLGGNVDEERDSPAFPRLYRMRLAAVYRDLMRLSETERPDSAVSYGFAHLRDQRLRLRASTDSAPIHELIDRIGVLRAQLKKWQDLTHAA